MCSFLPSLSPCEFSTTLANSGGARRRKGGVHGAAGGSREGGGQSVEGGKDARILQLIHGNELNF